MRLILVLFFLSHSIFTQTNFNLVEVEINRNLESLQINALQMDSDGFLWIGTANGLYRYDGYELNKLQANPESGEALRSTHIISLSLSTNNELLIGTDDGYSIYNIKESSFFNETRLDNDSTKLLDSHIHNVIEDNHYLWIASDGGLSRFNREDKSYTHFLPNFRGSNISYHHIKSVFKDSYDQIWVGTTQRLNRYINNRQFEKFHNNTEHYVDVELYNSNRINDIYEDSKKRLWLSTDYGITVMDAKTKRVLPEFLKVNNYLYSKIKVINKVIELNYNRYLIGAESGLYFIDLNSKSPYELKQISSNKIYSFEKFQNDIIWIGSNAGLYKMILNEESVQDYSNQLSKKAINAVYCMNELNGELWIGTDNGIYNFDDDLRFLYNQNNTKNIIFQDEQVAWFSGMGHEIAKYNLKSKTTRTVTLLNEDGTVFLDNHFMDGFYDNLTGKIWFASFSSGLTSMNITTNNVRYNILNVNSATGKSTNATKSIYLAKNRLILVGTAKGLNVYSIRDNTHKSYFTDYDIRSIYQDENFYWIGSLKNGLIQTDHNFNIINQFTREKGLASSHIVEILREKDELWVLTNKGLNNIHLEDNSIRRFNYSHNDFLKNSHEFYTMFKRSNGDFYIGSNLGMYSFSPRKLVQSFSTPNVNITDLKINNESVNKTFSSIQNKTFTLDYDRRNLAITFACTDYFKPSDNFYRYQMMGLDEDWIEVGNRNYVSYQHIPSGEYVFRVQAANHFGIWSENVAQFNLIVNKPYWLQSWFIILVLIVLMISFYLYTQGRNEKRREIEIIRNKIATDLHDQIGSTLTEITLLSEMAQISGENVQSELSKIEEKSRNTISEMGDLVWAINSDKDSFEDLIHRSQEFALNLLSYNDVRVQFDIDSQLKGTIKPKFRQNIYLMIKEIVHNIVKHAKASEVKVKMSLSHVFRLEISDNGQGISDPDKIGNGLINLRKRAKELNGEIEFINDKGLNVIFKTSKSEV